MDRVLNKATLTVRQRGRVLLTKPLCMIIITKAAKGKTKKQFHYGVRIGFSPEKKRPKQIPKKHRHLWGNQKTRSMQKQERKEETKEETQRGWCHGSQGKEYFQEEAVMPD